MRAFFLVLYSLLVIAAATQSAIAQQAVVTISKGATPRQVQVTIRNGPKACGMGVFLGKTREEERRIEPGETLTLTHTAPEDGTFYVEAYGLISFKGLFPVRACSFVGGAAIFSVAGADTTILHLKKPLAGSWSGLSFLTAGGDGKATDSFVIDSAAELGSYRDWVVLVDRGDVSMRSTLDGKKKLTNPKSLFRNSWLTCVLSFSGAGPSRPRNWRNGPPLEAAIWAENVPFHETRDYVKKVLSNTTNYAAILTGEPQSLKARLGTVAPREASAPPIDDKMP